MGPLVAPGLSVHFLRIPLSLPQSQALCVSGDSRGGWVGGGRGWVGGGRGQVGDGRGWVGSVGLVNVVV